MSLLKKAVRVISKLAEVWHNVARCCYSRATRGSVWISWEGKSMKLLQSAMMGFAAATVLAFVPGPAHAGCTPHTFTVVCKETTAAHTDLHGGDGSECFAQSDGSGLAKACASDSGSFADSEMSTGGTTHATAKGGSFSEAIADHAGTSVSHVSGAGGDGDATSDDKGTATTNATGGSEAHSSAFGNCDAKATSSAAGSLATAECTTKGGFAHVTATKGAIAEGSDTAPPTCTPGSTTGSIAKVRSTGGNCGP